MSTKVLLNAATATDATKVEFSLTNDDFDGVPSLRGAGYGAGDSSKLFFYVNGLWEDSGLVLSDTINELKMESLGRYAIDVTLALAGPVSAEIETSGRL